MIKDMDKQQYGETHYKVWEGPELRNLSPELEFVTFQVYGCVQQVEAVRISHYWDFYGGFITWA